MSINIFILGYGEIGHAMEFLLKNHQSLAIWDKYPPANLVPIKLEDSIPRADVVMFCLPVNPHREIIHRIAPYLQKHCLCISVAKGLDETGKTAAQIFSESLPPSCPYALLYGPMIAEEILAGRGEWRKIPFWSDFMYFFAMFIFWLASFKIHQKLFLFKADRKKCTKCGLCAKLCPVKNIEMKEYPVYGFKCQYCLRCTGVCPARAIPVIFNRKRDSYKAPGAEFN